MRLLALDFETNGLRAAAKQPLPWANYPVSVALWAMSEDCSMSQLYNSKISGATSFNAWATEQHAFTPHDLNDEPDFEEVLGRLAAAAAKYDVLVCHNVGYDIGKVLAPMCRLQGFNGAKLLDLPRVCSCKSAWASTVLDGKWLSLGELCNCFGVKQTTAHTSDGDAKALAECLAAALQYPERGLAKELWGAFTARPECRSWRQQQMLNE